MRPERRRLALAAHCALLLGLAPGSAFSATYVASAAPFAWTDSASHTNVVWTGAPGGPAAACTGGSAAIDDDVSDLLPIGFTFWFGGAGYTQLRVMSNGRVQFNNTYCNVGTASVGPPPTYPDPYPNASLARTIRVYGNDLDPTTGGSVRWASLGTSPNRQFVVTWLDVKEWNQPTSRYQLQIVLNEDGSFELRYGTIVNPGGGKAEIGWELDNSDYEKRIFTSIASLVNSAQRYSIPAPVAEYRFDEGVWSGVAGEILDASGSGNHGTARGTAASTAAGRVCRGGSFPANSTGPAIAAATTALAVPAAGTITLWARIDSVWNASAAAALIDASRSQGAAPAHRAFQLLKDASGRLVFTLSNNGGTRFTATSGAYSFASGQWQHLAISWSFAAGRMDLYLNGAAVANRRGGAINPANLETLWFGDAHDGLALAGTSVNSTNGAQDEVRVYAYEGTAALIQRDMGATHSCPSTSSFLLAHDQLGIHCVAEAASVTARAGDGSTVTTYSGAVTLDTQTGRGSWQSHAGNLGSFSDGAADDGLATYSFFAGDGGFARFWLTYRAGPTPMDVDVYETASPGVRDDDVEGALAFGPSGFVVTAAALSNPPPVAINSVIPAQTAGTAFALYLAAYGQTPTDPECGVIETYTGAKTLGVWASALDPTSFASAVAVNGVAVGSSPAAATPLPVNFASGQASVSAQHDDVGRISLSFRDSAPAEPVGGVQGASAGIVVRPASFAITSVTRADGSGNPGAPTPAGAVFVAAGVPFAVTLEARSSAGVRTPSYGLESSPEGIELRSAALLAPAGGRNGSGGAGALGAGASFVAIAPAGSFRNSSVSFDEVGAIALQAHVADADYLGAGDVWGAASGAVGRFTPQRFEVALDPVSFSTGCAAGGFSYLGQPFDFEPASHPVLRATAVSQSGTATANYSGGWFRLTPATISPRSWSALHGGLDSAGPNAPRVEDLGGGQARVSFDQGPALAFVRAAPEAPFSAEIGIQVSVLDQDGVAYAANPLAIGQPLAGAGITFSDGNSMRWGRLAFQNAYGPELRDLAVPLRAESFDGIRFGTHLDELCLSVPAAQIQLTPSPPSLVSSASVANAPFAAGDAGLSLSAPGAGNTGSVDLGIDLSAGGLDLPFLQYDWNGDGSYSEDPSGRATFGIYRGSDARIDLRERY